MHLDNTLLDAAAWATDDQAFSLELKVPNAETLAAMDESRALMTQRRARFASADELFADLEKNSGK